MTQNDDDRPVEPTERQDPLVERLRPDPTRPAVRVLTFDGLAGRSDRPGYRRLYLSSSVDRYIEVRAEKMFNQMGGVFLAVNYDKENGPTAMAGVSARF